MAHPTGLLFGELLGSHVKYKLAKGKDNGKENSRVSYTIDADAATPLGPYSFRIATPGGVSNLRLFTVDDLPQTLEASGNNSQEKAQTVANPTVVVGQVDANASDFYKIKVNAGQRLSVDVIARRIGSTLDSQITIYDSKGRELAYNNDSLGCQGDSRHSLLLKDAGEYLVEVRDVLNRGGTTYFYRLRLGDFPLATAPYPMAAKRGSKIKLGFAGPMVEGLAPQEIAVPADDDLPAIWVAPRGPSGLHGWTVPLLLTDVDEVVETEPNDDPAKANKIPVPGGVTGRFQKSSDTDYYSFTAKKGTKYVIEAQTLELFSPTLVYLTVKDAKTGKELAKFNSNAAPPADQVVQYTATADGDLLLEAEHLNYLGGPEQIYRISVTPYEPGFEASLSSDQVDILPGATFPIQVEIKREGYNGPIELSATGSPLITGKGEVASGSKSGIIYLSVKKDAMLGAYAFKVQARAKIGKRDVVRYASVRDLVSKDLADLTFPPLTVYNQAVLSVREKAPVTLAVATMHPESSPGLTVDVTVSAQREKGYDDAITINAPTGVPPSVKAPKIPAIPKGKNEITFKLAMNAKTPMGEYLMLFSGSTKKGKEVVPTAFSPLVIKLGDPFDLKVEPAEIALKPGEKMKLKVSAIRRGGYSGPVNLEVRKLPKGVTAGKATIAKDKNEAEIELSADAKSAAVVMAAIDVEGTATTLNNLKNASPPIKLRVEKK